MTAIHRTTARFAVTAALAGVAFATGLPAASAQVDSPNNGNGWNTVLCDSDAHTARIDVMMFPEEATYSLMRTWAKVWVWTAAKGWLGEDWHQVDSQGFEETVTLPAGTSYEYVQYAFENENGTFDYVGEWAGDGSGYGTYSDQYGYQTDPSCQT